MILYRFGLCFLQFLIEHIENLFKTNTKFTDKDGKLFVPKILEANR